MALVCALLVAAFASSAQASPPAQGQYRLHLPNSGAGPDAGTSAPVNDSSGGSSNAAAIVLGAGVVTIAGAGALVVWRRRRAQPRNVS